MGPLAHGSGDDDGVRPTRHQLTDDVAEIPRTLTVNVKHHADVSRRHEFETRSVGLPPEHEPPTSRRDRKGRRRRPAREIFATRQPIFAMSLIANDGVEWRPLMYCEPSQREAPVGGRQGRM